MGRERGAWVLVLLLAAAALGAAGWLVLSRHAPAAPHRPGSDLTNARAAGGPAAASPLREGSESTAAPEHPHRARTEPRAATRARNPLPKASPLFLEGEVLDAETLLPIRGAQVCVREGNGDAGPAGAARQENMSGPAGRFRIEVSPEETLLEIEVMASGFVPWSASPLRAGDHVVAMLARPATVSVRVLRPGGARLARATVRLDLAGGSGESPLSSRRTGLTDEEGLARLTDVQPGKHWFTVLHPDYEPYRHPAAVWVPLESPEPIVVSLHPWFRLAGTVRDETTRRGIKGASLFLGGELQTQRTTTDPEGRFEFPQGADGRSFLHAGAEGYAERWIDVLGEVLPGARVVEDQVRFEVLLRRDAAVVVGRVISPGGAGIPGAGIRLSRSMPRRAAGFPNEDVETSRVGGWGEEEPWSWRMAGSTDPEGRFRLSHLEPFRDYECIAGGASLGGSAFRGFATPGPGEELDLGDVLLQPWAGVYGRVADLEEHALAGVDLLLSPWSPPVAAGQWTTWQPQRPTFVRRTRSGPTGWFLFRRLWPGAYTIEVAGAPPVSVTLAPGAREGPLRFALAESQLPEGQVSWTVRTTDLSGTALPGMVVSGTLPSRPDRVLFGSTGKEGQLALRSPRGELVRISVWDPEGAYRTQAVQFADPADLPSRTLEIRLDRETSEGLRIQGTLASPVGRPLAGIRVELWPVEAEDAAGLGRRITFTDASGAFSFSVASEDYWLLPIDAHGRFASPVQGPLSPATGTIEIRMQEAGP